MKTVNNYNIHTVKRKYLPIEKYPVYNNLYNRLMLDSRILNGGSELIPSAFTELWDKRHLTETLKMYVGDASGFRENDGARQLALIPSCEMKLKQIEKRFEEYQLMRVNNGYARPKEMPLALQNEFYECEARLSILQGEKEVIENKLKQITDAAKKAEADLVLAFGLRCNANFHGIGTSAYQPEVALAQIDNQIVSQLKDGTLFIDDPRSPYDGMDLPTYRKLAKQWVQSRIDEDNQLLERMQKEAKEQGLPKPYTTGKNLNSKINKASLPPFPSWAINHKEVKYKRKRKEI